MDVNNDDNTKKSRIPSPSRKMDSSPSSRNTTITLESSPSRRTISPSRLPSRIPSLPSQAISSLKTTSSSTTTTITATTEKIGTRIKFTNLEESNSTIKGKSNSTMNVESNITLNQNTNTKRPTLSKKESRLPLSPSLKKRNIELSPIQQIENIVLDTKSSKQNVRFDKDNDEEEDENINLSNVTETDGNFWDSNTNTNSNQNDIIMDENWNKDEECKDDEININKKQKEGFFFRFYQELAGIDPDEEEEGESAFHFIKNAVESYSKSILVYFLGVGPLFVPEIYPHLLSNGDRRVYRLNMFQRIFVMLENPISCKLGQIVSLAMFSIIILSCINYIIATLPQLNTQPETCDEPVCSYDTECPNTTICEPIPPQWLTTVELACVIIFTIEFGTRMVLIGFIPPRLAELIPQQILKFKLDTEMINDEESLFEFTKRSLSGTKLTLSRHFMSSSKPSNIDTDVLYDQLRKDSVDDEEIVDVSNIQFNSFNDKAYEKIDISIKENDNFFTKTSKMFRIAFFPPLKLLDPLSNKLASSRINERLDMPWYIRILKYQFSVMNLIDLCAILPYYVQLATSSSSSLSFIRLLRLARIFRVLKVGRSSSGVKIIMKAMKKAASALGIVTFFIPLGIVFFGSVVFLFEGGDYTVSEDFPDGSWVRRDAFGVLEESPYTSIPTSMYWAVVTSTTTGYGDIVPTTVLGRTLALLCMYYGVLLMALPITVIGNNFTREYERYYGNSSEKMVFQCLLDIARVTNDETIMRAQGLIPIESTEFKLTRLALIITIFDNTKRDALKRSLISTIRKRKKVENSKPFKTAAIVHNVSTDSLLNEIYDMKENRKYLQNTLKKLTESMTTQTVKTAKKTQNQHFQG